MLIVSFDLLGSQSVSMEREEFLKLVKKEVKSALHCLLALILLSWTFSEYFYLMLQVDLYNSMVEKGGTDDEEEARKAYLAAREDSDRSAQKAIADKTSSALLDRVTTKFIFLYL